MSNHHDMNTITYESIYHVSLRFMNRYSQIIKPNRIRNTLEHKASLLQLSTIYNTLLKFICYQRFFNTRPNQQNELHSLQLYLAYQDGFIEEYSNQKTTANHNIEKIKLFIEDKMKDETWLLADHGYHLYEQVLHQGTKTIHIFGLYQKTYSGSYCFFLLDYIHEHEDRFENKIHQDERYCLRKYNDFMLHIKKHKYSTVEIFCREENLNYKTLQYRFKQHYGITFNQFHTRQRLLYTLLLIIYSRKTLLQISRKGKYEEYNSFSKAFKNGGFRPSQIIRLLF